MNRLDDALKLSKKMEDCHRTAKLIQGDEYHILSAFWQTAVQSEMRQSKKHCMEAAINLIKKFDGSDNDRGLLTINIMAACYEIMSKP
jgi:hypothetical protein